MEIFFPPSQTLGTTPRARTNKHLGDEPNRAPYQRVSSILPWLSISCVAWGFLCLLRRPQSPIEAGGSTKVTIMQLLPCVFRS